MERLVRRDRNHPSVIIWSLCNEGMCNKGIPGGVAEFSRRGTIAKNIFKKWDPLMGRPVTTLSIPPLPSYPTFLFFLKKNLFSRENTGENASPLTRLTPSLEVVLTCAILLCNFVLTCAILMTRTLMKAGECKPARLW